MEGGSPPTTIKKEKNAQSRPLTALRESTEKNLLKLKRDKKTPPT